MDGEVVWGWLGFMGGVSYVLGVWVGCRVCVGFELYEGIRMGPRLLGYSVGHLDWAVITPLVRKFVQAAPQSVICE